MEWILTEEAMRERKIRQCDSNPSSDLASLHRITRSGCVSISFFIMALRETVTMAGLRGGGGVRGRKFLDSLTLSI